MRNSHENRPKKAAVAMYMPSIITCVILPLSTCFPEKSLETASPAAMKVKKSPVPEAIPMLFAYIATYVVFMP